MIVLPVWMSCAIIEELPIVFGRGGLRLVELSARVDPSFGLHFWKPVFLFTGLLCYISTVEDVCITLKLIYMPNINILSFDLVGNIKLKLFQLVEIVKPQFIFVVARAENTLY